MKWFFSSIIIAWAATSFAGQVANLNKDGVILDGYDAVSYFSAKQPLKGDKKYQTKVDGATYWFSNNENLQTFLKEPKKYQPQFGGWCAYAVADSKSKVEVDPKSFLIQDGRLLLFYNGLWGNTREKWSNTKNKDAATYLKEADAHWPEVQNKEP